VTPSVDGYGALVRQRNLETACWCASPARLSGVTPGATGTFGQCTTRDSLRFAAAARAHDETGRAALPHATFICGRLLAAQPPFRAA